MLIYKISDLIVFKALKSIKYGFLEIKKTNGEVLKFGNPDETLKVFLEIKDESLNYNLIKSGSIGLGESYMKDFFITNNLSDLIELTAKNIKIIYKFSGIFDLPFINFIKNKIIKNTKSRSKENIAKHYDLGNDFFSLWLDKTLTYSSAIFEEPNQELFAAQNNKYQKLIDLLKPSNGSKILEIGCGWGGFISEAHSKGYDVKGLTLSKEQQRYSEQLINNKKLNAHIYLQDYRHEKGKFDNIVSIEMFEAVGKKYWDDYFIKIKECLKKEGRAVVQTITIGDEFYKKYLKTSDYIREYIFPGGFLPSPSIFNKLAKKHGLYVVDEFEFLS